MRPLIFLALLVSFSLLSAAASAQDTPKPPGLSVNDVQQFTEKAEKGDALSQGALGGMY
jgi:hypothetical protein